MKTSATEKEMSSTNEPERVQVRCILLGGSAVGKSTFLKKLTNATSANNTTDADYSMTSRVEVHSKSYVPGNGSRLQVEVCFLDTPGRAPYQALVEGVCKRATTAGKCLIVALFDVTNRASMTPLEGLLTWLNKQQQQSNSGKTSAAAATAATEGVLVANKIDLVDKRIVSPSEGQQKAKMFKLRYFECSALNDIAMADFDQLILDMVQTMLAPPADIAERSGGGGQNGGVPAPMSGLKSID